MPGTATYLPPPGSLDLGPFNPVRVYRLGKNGYELLPHVRVHSIHRREGPEPGSAELAYVFDDRLTAAIGAPDRVEQVWPPSPASPWCVNIDDRIVVAQDLPASPVSPPGTAPGKVLLFDGFAQNPQPNFASGTEQVTFTVIGTPVREWDAPLGGAIDRDMDDPATPGAWVPSASHNDRDRGTDRPIRFNPDGLPNCTPAGADSGDDATPNLFPAFTDPTVVRSPDVRRYWTVGPAARYILCCGNPEQRWTRYDQAIWQMDGLLRVAVPKDNDTPIDLDDPDTFDWKEITCQDLDVSNKAWPVALDELIAPHGFSFTWRLGQGKDENDPADPDADDRPIWQLVIYRKDDPTPARSFGLQPAGYLLDTNLTNVGTAQISMDTTQRIAAVVVDSEPALYEITVVLAPLFSIDATDATAANRTKFVKSATPGTTTDLATYRNFGLDETGDGHWSFTLDKWLAAVSGDTDAVTDFARLIDAMTAVFTDPGTVDDGATPADWNGATLGKPKRFAIRRRPGIRQLLTSDPTTGERLNAKLWIVRDSEYTGPVPGFFDRTKLAAGKVLQPVILGGWELLPDRLGFRVTEKDPNDWKIGQPTNLAGGVPKFVANLPYPKGLLNVVEGLASPDAAKHHPLFHFVLTCVIRGDRGLDARARPRRSASRGAYYPTRREDARDRYRLEVVTADSEFNDTTVPDPIRDDTDTATRHAVARRTANETPRMAGSITVPRLVRGIRVGDKVKGIDGRDISLRVTGGTSASEGDRFPTVVGIDWSFKDRFATTFALDWKPETAVRPGREGGLVHGRVADRIMNRGV